MKNPYNPRGPTDPRYYANREDLLSTFRGNIDAVVASKGVTKPLNIAVLGQWGIGKTSTLIKFRDIIQNESRGARLFSSLVPLKPSCCVDADTFFGTVLENIFRDYKTTTPLSEKVQDFIKEELDVLNRWKLAKLSLSPELERKQEIVSAVRFKDILLNFWGKLKDHDFDLAIIMLDDIQYVFTQEKGEILYDLRTDMQALAADGALFMFIITGPLQLYPEIQDKAEPFTRLFERFNLVPFDRDGTREQIAKPLAVEGINLRISEEVIKELHGGTAGHPYFVSLAMRYLVNRIPEGEVTPEDFRALYPDLIEYFAKEKFDDDFDRATEAEGKILMQIAGFPKAEFSPIEIGGRSKAPLLERLVSRGLIEKVGRGRYRLYNPMFSDYLRRKA